MITIRQSIISLTKNKRNSLSLLFERCCHWGIKASCQNKRTNIDDKQVSGMKEMYCHCMSTRSDIFISLYMWGRALAE